jgi:hypothetical protein
VRREVASSPATKSCLYRGDEDIRLAALFYIVIHSLDWPGGSTPAMGPAEPTDGSHLWQWDSGAYDSGLHLIPKI